MTTGSGIALGSWRLTEESVRSYLAGAGDDLDLYLREGLVPPLALAAYALGELLEKLALPPGTIHSSQDMDVMAPVSLGDQVAGEATLERPRSRGGLQFTTVSYTLINGAGGIVQTGKTTVLVPATGGEPG